MWSDRRAFCLADRADQLRFPRLALAASGGSVALGPSGQSPLKTIDRAHALAGQCRLCTDPEWTVTWLLIASFLCLTAGFARYASYPLTPCWTPDDLAYYNLPPDRAFDREAPQVVVTGMVSSYPTVEDTKQTIVVTVDSTGDPTRM